jgi:hypothetical protein
MMVMSQTVSTSDFRLRQRRIYCLFFGWLA